MKTIRIYDPSMCCSTGVCGPGVDPELIRVAKVVDRLKEAGYDVQRFSLSQDPGAFVAEPLISQILREEGEDALPVTLVDGEKVKSGNHLSNDEFQQHLDLPADYLQAEKKSSGCCGGTDCC